MIYSKFIFPIKQRLFWKKVRSKKKSWRNLITTNESVITTTEDQITFELHKDDLLSELIYSESFEWAEKEWIKSFLKNGMVFYDIGANVGFYTLIAAKQVGSSGQIYSFEPSPLTVERLKINISKNPIFSDRIKIFENAISNQNSEMEIFVSKQDLHAWNSLAKPQNASDFVPQKISAKRLDDIFIEQNLKKPDLIKIDIEGWEKYALEGALEILKKYSPTLIIEFTKEHLERTNTNYKDLSNILKNLDYELFEYLPRTKELVSIYQWDFDHKNIIAIRRNA